MALPWVETRDGMPDGFSRDFHGICVRLGFPVESHPGTGERGRHGEGDVGCADSPGFLSGMVAIGGQSRRLPVV